MNRRDFLLLRNEPDGFVAELSCERLYMHYQHASITMTGDHQPGAADAARELVEGEPPSRFSERTPQQLFEDVDRELQGADVLRVTHTEWLTVDAFGKDVEELVAAFRRRGGRVE